MAENSAIILYQSQEGGVNIEVQLSDGTVWLNQSQMAELFQTERSVITKHINNVIKSGELDKDSVCAKFAQTASDGKNYQVEHYNLDMIISVGYRVSSHRGVQFRIWATKTLGEYVVKGFVVDDDRLSGKRTNYFDELIERVRKIRTSEANFYDKVKAIFGTSIDYQTGSDDAKLFYAIVQNKFHYAITGYTAAETIVNRVNAFKPKMGLVHTKGDIPTRKESEVAKNYLEELELKRLELLVDQFLSFAELQSLEKRPMYMKDWKNKLDAFILLNDKEVLTHSGKVSRVAMQKIVSEEREIYKRQLLESSEFSSEVTKDDFEQSLRKVSEPILPKSSKRKTKK